jgi:UDP-N-acetylglucosamine diphosphorylase / glucose-1-phosphate thymidylyltransferase / UDP-N-acetylgalactosamine diphosphorylase / glucosamine-1-phosphate N-acetyltransferase / galactosamine-1-phosphate N-acetyltransferase
MGIALFEDSHWQNFSPLSLTKATFDIKIGCKSLFEEHMMAPEVLLTREYLAGVTGERHAQCKVNPSSIDGDTVFVNGLLHPGAIYPDRLAKVRHTFAITAGDRLLVARLDRKGSKYLSDCVAAGKKIDVRKLDVEKSTKLRAEESQGLLSEPWDIISVLENSLALQASNMQGESNLGPGVRVAGNNTVATGRNASVEEGTVLDARNGGIYIGPDAYVATSRIVGPAYIGGRTQVKQFTIIESSYVGYDCRVAGEIEHSIISDHTNKAHAGFIGHSYVGEWVNVGAMTTTSDLKMTYGNIKMSSGKGKVDTGQNKVGSFFADMCKTSIGTLIYSGRRIGVSSHLHGLVAQDVPSFTIYGASIGAKNAELELRSAIETQKKMMSRRNQAMSKAYEQMIKDIFSMTAIDRRRAGVRKSRFAL